MKPVSAFFEHSRWQISAWFSAVTVLVLAAIPVPQLDAPPDSDKAVHFAMFAALGYLFLSAYPLVSQRRLLAALVCYGAALEALQYLLPYRSASAFDVAANVAGTLCAAGIHIWTHTAEQHDKHQ